MLRASGRNIKKKNKNKNKGLCMVADTATSRRRSEQRHIAARTAVGSTRLFLTCELNYVCYKRGEGFCPYSPSILPPKLCQSDMKQVERDGPRQ